MIHNIAELLRLEQDTFRVADELVALRRTDNALIAARKQTNIEFLLNFLYRKADGRLRNEQRQRRAIDASAPRSLHDVSQMIQRHTTASYPLKLYSKTTILSIFAMSYSNNDGSNFCITAF